MGAKIVTAQPQTSRDLLEVPPGEYVLLVRAMYEIRMFGDSGVGKCPVVRLKVQVEVDEVEDLEMVLGIKVIPDVVGGWLMGDWISIGVRVPAASEDVVISGAESEASSVGLAAVTRI